MTSFTMDDRALSSYQTRMIEGSTPPNFEGRMIERLSSVHEGHPCCSAMSVHHRLLLSEEAVVAEKVGIAPPTEDCMCMNTGPVAANTHTCAKSRLVNRKA